MLLTFREFSFPKAVPSVCVKSTKWLIASSTHLFTSHSSSESSCIIEEAINHLVDFGKQEGTALEKKFNEKIDNIESLLKSIEPQHETERVAKIRERT